MLEIVCQSIYHGNRQRNVPQLNIGINLGCHQIVVEIVDCYDLVDWSCCPGIWICSGVNDIQNIALNPISCTHVGQA